jgi:cytochrome c-type biogenesis protein CcmH/NrfF
MISGLKATCAVLVWLSLTTSPPLLNAEADMAVIEGTVICTCGCPNMVLNTCICGHADEMRAEIRILIDEGNNEEEVIQILIQRYGERILAEPKAEGFNLAAYVTPFLALLFGSGLLITLIRRWKRNSSEVVEDRLPSQELEGDDPYMLKLKEELDTFKD